jgi:lycopene cyclase domain-containing protein
MSYWLLNLFFVVPALMFLALARKYINWKVLGLAAVALFILTAVFDNFIVGSGIVAYDEKLISGILIGFAPIEDFAYTLVATILIPICWWWLSRKENK